MSAKEVIANNATDLVIVGLFIPNGGVNGSENHIIYLWYCSRCDCKQCNRPSDYRWWR